MEKNGKEQAQEIFKNLNNYLQKADWNYAKIDRDGDGTVFLIAQGEDLSMGLMIKIDAERQLVYIMSQLPFVMDKEKLLEGAVATSMINQSLIDGSFDYDVKNGTISFRITTSWRGVLISDEIFEYLIMVSFLTIDKYNDKLLEISNGTMSLKELDAFIVGDKE